MPHRRQQHKRTTATHEGRAKLLSAVFGSGDGPVVGPPLGVDRDWRILDLLVFGPLPAVAAVVVGSHPRGRSPDPTKTDAQADFVRLKAIVPLPERSGVGGSPGLGSAPSLALAATSGLLLDQSTAINYPLAETEP
jgi:hypothetical protein